MGLLRVVLLSILLFSLGCRGYLYTLVDESNSYTRFGRLDTYRQDLDDIKKIATDIKRKPDRRYLTKVSDNYMRYVRELAPYMENDKYDYSRLAIQFQHTVDSLVDIVIEVDSVRVGYLSSGAIEEFGGPKPVTRMIHLQDTNYYITYIEPIPTKKQYQGNYFIEFNYRIARASDKAIVLKRRIRLLYEGLWITY